MISDEHCHFHGGLPLDWLYEELRRSSDPLGVSLRLQRAVARVARLITTSQLVRPNGAHPRGALFAAYSLVERHCEWMESKGFGSRDLFERGSRALSMNATASGVSHTLLFVSLVPDKDRMRARLTGLASTAREFPGSLSLRLTIPRLRAEALTRGCTTSDLVHLLGPFVEDNLFRGFDISGLDEHCTTSDTLALLKQVSSLRDALGVEARSRLPIAVHWGESVALDGLEPTIKLGRELVARGVGSLGHALLYWSPDSVLSAPEAAGKCEGLFSEGWPVSLEICPAVSRLYGSGRGVSVSETLDRLGSHPVKFGTDSPGLLGYEDFMGAAERIGANSPAVR